MTDLNKKLKEISETVYNQSPELKDIIDRVSNGELSENEAIMEMMQAVMQDDGLNTALTTFASETKDEIEGQLKLTNPAIFQAPSGLPKLDPMFEARLFERIQFDEDAPELRVGPLPHGVSPAVPVANAPANPVALGASLKSASEKMDEEIKHLLETGESTTEITKYGFANLPQPAGYQPGQLPALINVASPVGSELAIMPVPQQQELAWKAAVTTQGRRSAAQTIQARIVEYMKDIGFDIETRNMIADTENILVKAVWTFSILGTGSESTQNNFSPITNASASMLKEILKKFETAEGVYDISKPLWFEINTVDFIDERRVGWASLIREK